MAAPREVLRVGAEVEVVMMIVDTHAATETVQTKEADGTATSIEATVAPALAPEVRTDTIAREGIAEIEMI